MASVGDAPDNKDIFDFDQEINRREVPSLKYSSLVLGNDGSSHDDKNDLFVAGVADMDFAVAPCIQSAVQQRCQHAILGYETVPSGLYPAVCDWIQRQHYKQPPPKDNMDPPLGLPQPRHFLRAPNVLNSLAMTLQSFTQPGDGVIVQPPVFFDFFDIIAENKRTLVENPLFEKDGRYTMDLRQLDEVAAAKAKVMFLCNPHNPIGRVWTRKELLDLADICRKHNVLIVADEIHGDLCFYPEQHPFVPMASVCPDICITLTSPAKTFNIAGCCTAFTIIANDDLRNRMQVENSKLTLSKNNAFASVAMEAAYREGDAWLEAVKKYLVGNITLLRERLLQMPNIELVEPQGTFLMWLDCRKLPIDDSDGYTLRQWFRTQAGWAVTRGAAFGPQGHGFVRVNIACPRRKLDSALDRLHDAVSRLQ